MQINNQKGQTLLELVVLVAIVVVVVSSLVFANILTSRNSQFSKNQSQATKLAQEALEKVRTLRDRDGTINTLNLAYPGRATPPINKFSELWCNNLSVSCAGDCSFKFD